MFDYRLQFGNLSILIQSLIKQYDILKSNHLMAVDQYKKLIKKLADENEELKYKNKHNSSKEFKLKLEVT